MPKKPVRYGFAMQAEIHSKCSKHEEAWNMNYVENRQLVHRHANLFIIIFYSLLSRPPIVNVWNYNYPSGILENFTFEVKKLPNVKERGCSKSFILLQPLYVHFLGFIRL